MIHYVIGDATQPIGDGPKVIAHIVNTRGGWGRGFVLALSARWPEPEWRYRSWHESGVWFSLGRVQTVPVGEELWVANMLAQDGYSVTGRAAVKLDALEACLTTVCYVARGVYATVHIPRIGTGLGGRTWEEIEPVLDRTCAGVEVYVYDLPSAR